MQTADLSVLPYSLLNRKACLVLLSKMLLFSSTTSFFLFKANSVTEYGSSFSGAVAISANMLYFVATILEMSNIIALIAEFEDFIEKSTCFDTVYWNFC